MQELKIEQMENVFGIKKLNINVANNSLSQDIIYSKNGVFKTSFAKCLHELSFGDEMNVKDRITNNPAKIKIKIINSEFENTNLKNKFIVFSREIYEKKKKFLSNYDEELKLLTIRQNDKEYIEDLIYGDTEEPLIELEGLSKKIGINFNKAMELLGNKNEGYLDNILNILKLIDEAPVMQLTEINFKKIFQKTYDFIENSDFKESVTNYINIVNKRIKEELFDDNFDENNCLSFLDTIKKQGYLSKEKHRGLIIQDREYYNFEELEELFKNTITKIIENPEVLEKNRELLKTIGNSTESITIKKEIIDNPILVKELSLGRKELIRIALKNSGLQTKYWIGILENTRKELKKVLNKVKSKKSYFEKAIDIYKKRFHPVFDIEIVNKQESMLGLEMPYISFKHRSNPNYVLEEEKLYEILSSGEKTTLNIIKFIVEYISNKNNNPIIVLDDIVETFDYSNRYAFIEYINDMVKDEVTIIILTHNFEFYKTLSSRIPSLRRLTVFVDKKGIVNIQKNKNIFRNMENILNITNEESIYFAIPYLREAKYILKEDTTILTACLHYKEITKKLILEDILNFFPSYELKIDVKKSYLDGLKEIANKIKDFDEFDLAKKTILSIGCRIFLEEKIINDNFSLVEKIKENQFANLKNIYENQLEDNVIQLMEKVQLSTPEFIHGNAFMYEPLVDIDGKYLMEIYNEICKLDPQKVWKKQFVCNNSNKIEETATI